MFPAHIKYLDDGSRVVQSVKEHCESVGSYAAQDLSPIGLGPVGEVVGLLHDMGKCSEESRRYQEDAAAEKDVVKGSVIHTFQCCRYLLEKHKGDLFADDISREVMAYAASAHHGLYDCFDENRKSGFEHRIKADCNYFEAKDNYFTECIGEKTIADKVDLANQCLERIYKELELLYSKEQPEEPLFYYSCLIRLITSAVIDGDRRDAAEFSLDINYPEFPKDMTAIWEERVQHVEKMLSDLPHSSPLQIARQKISNQCRAAAESENTLLRLNVPTGGGKTLGALRFAIAHAAKYNKRRIIFVSPQLNIIDQNSDEIKKYVGDDSLILEHHSDVMASELSKKEEMLTENWNAPIIITTVVQFLNTLFSGRTSCIRRMCALINSVVIIDEVQMIPNKMLTLFNLMVNFLTKICKTTVVLCSATQPTLHKTEHHLYKVPDDIVTYDGKLWSIFKRTQYVCEKDAALEDIPEIVIKRAAEHNSFLCICNTKKEAQFVYEAVIKKHKCAFFYSAGMCTSHRKAVLDQIKKAITDKNERVICIATRAMEAGIDVSFEAGMRFTAGYDNYIQAAGRCNRNGESADPVPFYNIHCIDENLGSLKELKMGKNVMLRLTRKYNKHPEQFDNQFDSEKAIEFYYNTLYSQMSEKYQDYCVENHPSSIFELLSCNINYANKDSECFEKYFLKQAMKTAGDLFSVFEDKTKTVVVPYGDGVKLIEELKAKCKITTKYLFEWLQKIKPYTVSVYDNQIDKIRSFGGIKVIEGVMILQPEHYHNILGVVEAPVSTAYSFLEV